MFLGLVRAHGLLGLANLAGAEEWPGQTVEYVITDSESAVPNACIKPGAVHASLVAPEPATNVLTIVAGGSRLYDYGVSSQFMILGYAHALLRRVIFSATKETSKNGCIINYSPINPYYSTSCRFRAMRTPLMRTWLLSMSSWFVISESENCCARFLGRMNSTASERSFAPGAVANRFTTEKS